MRFANLSRREASRVALLSVTSCSQKLASRRGTMRRGAASRGLFRRGEPGSGSATGVVGDQFDCSPSGAVSGAASAASGSASGAGVSGAGSAIAASLQRAWQRVWSFYERRVQCVQKINVALHSPPRRFTVSPKASEIQKRIRFTEVSRRDTRSYGFPPCWKLMRPP